MWRQPVILKNILYISADLTSSKLVRFGWVIGCGRCLSSSAGQEGVSAGNVEAAQLKSRALVRLHGPDLHPLLQGLITNDIEHLSARPAVYSLLLNPQGRVLYDVILYSSPDKPQSSLLIECASALRSKLIGHLKIFRVKRKVEIEPEDRLSIWVIHKSQEEEEADQLRGSDTKISPEPCCPASLETPEPGSVPNCLGFLKSRSVLDPRLQNLGWRVLLPQGEDIGQGIKVKGDEEGYRRLRYCLGVGEGSAELPPGSCFPLESNGDYLHGISFQKGCYVGQELTARTYHTGVIRKRLMSFRLEDGVRVEGIKFDSEIVNGAGKSVGKVRGWTPNSRSGIALVRVEEVVGKGHLKVKLNGDAAASVTICRPFWWPAVPSTSTITSSKESWE